MTRYYRTYTQYLQEKFGCRVYKVTLDGGFTCPNRDGTKGRGGCTFCDDTGSSSRAQERGDSITEQVLKNIEKRRTRVKADKFIAYFQSFTNTYSRPERLKRLYDEAVFAHPDVVGLAISTRSDCVDEEKMALIASYKDRIPYVCVEYGMQTIHDRTLERMNRCETHEDFVRSLALTRQYDVEHCVHVILGLPGESWEEQMATADRLAELRVDGVKIHLLVAMENTADTAAFLRGEWEPLEIEEYVSLCCDFLERLHPECVIHRVSGNGHPKHVIAPRWMQQRKNDVIQRIDREFERRGTRQGSRCQWLAPA
jgi:radical SAM protein (TIGR01212 family)